MATKATLKTKDTEIENKIPVTTGFNTTNELVRLKIISCYATKK